MNNMATIDDTLTNIKNINEALELDVQDQISKLEKQQLELEKQLERQQKDLQSELNTLNDLKMAINVLKLKNINIGHRCLFTPSSLDGVAANLIELKPKTIYLPSGSHKTFKAVITLEVDVETLSVLL